MGGKAIIFSAPSGSGKTTIVQHLLSHSDLPLGFSISATTRAPRGQERDGVDYHFLDLESFVHHIDAGDLLEWEEVYPEVFYGTLQHQLDRMWSLGKTVVFDVDVVGGVNLKRLLGADALAIFVQPPSLEILRDRLVNRGTESPQKVEERMAKAAWEWSQSESFDRILVNEDLLDACAQAEEWAAAHIESSQNQV